jgi:hypothetical protein
VEGQRLFEIHFLLLINLGIIDQLGLLAQLKEKSKYSHYNSFSFKCRNPIWLSGLVDSTPTIHKSDPKNIILLVFSEIEYDLFLKKKLYLTFIFIKNIK